MFKEFSVGEFVFRFYQTDHVWVCSVVESQLDAVIAEQAEQEPVAWLCDGEAYEVQQYDWKTDLPFPNQIPLYAAPVRTKDLTDDEIGDVVGKLWGTDGMFTCHDFARAVIAADRKKNR